MNLKKTATFFKDARSIWVGILMAMTAIVYAADTRYITQDNLRNSEIRQLLTQVQILNAKLGYADQQAKLMIKAEKAILEGEIKKLEAE